MKNNREYINQILAKVATGDMATGGLMNAKQATAFYNSVIDTSVFKNNVRTEFMREPIMEIDKMALGGRVLTPKTEGIAPSQSDYVKPTFGKIELTTKGFVAPASITWDTLEDNIEGAGFEDTFMQTIATQIANDIEEIALNGDTTSLDPFLAQFDGYLKLMQTGGHDVTTAGSVTNEHFSKVLRGMPIKFRRSRNDLRFFLNPTQEQDYRDYLTTRQTALGDNTTINADQIKVFGIMVVTIPTLPDGWLFMSHFQNFILGIHRAMRLEKDRDIMAGTNLYAYHTRIGVQIQDTDAISFTDDITNA